MYVFYIIILQTFYIIGEKECINNVTDQVTCRDSKTTKRCYFFYY